MALLIVCFGYYLVAGPLEQATTRAALTFFGIVYAGLGIGALGALRGLPQGFEWVLFAIALTCGNDTGALLRRSRSWAGTSSTWPSRPTRPGKVSSAGWFSLSAWCSWRGRPTSRSCSSGTRWVWAFPASILGPTGDLCESMLKRAYGVKDSGKIIPGHGGLLDRVDALLFNGPYVLFYALTRFG